MVLPGELGPAPVFSHPHPHSRNPLFLIPYLTPPLSFVPRRPNPAHTCWCWGLSSHPASSPARRCHAPRLRPPVGLGPLRQGGRRREGGSGSGVGEGRRRRGPRRPLLRDSGKGVSREEVGNGRGLKGRGQERGPREEVGQGRGRGGPGRRAVHPPASLSPVVF